MIAALYVARRGSYSDLADVEPWDEDRDARTYDGPHPVVAHPPCARWCRLAALVEARHPHLRRGEDDGCFEAALAAVRTYGGVLEHPAWSDAFTAFALPIPPTAGGWQAGICGGWSCYVEQGRYGHPAKKATWLYSYGVDFLPPMRWGRTPDNESEALVSWCGNHTTEARWAASSSGSAATHNEARLALVSDGGASGKRRYGEPRRALVSGATWPTGEHWRRLSPKEASATPEPFDDELLTIARGAWGRRYSRLSSFERAGDQPELSAKARSATPEPFRDALLNLARGAAADRPNRPAVLEAMG